jgi:hypothetical protein
MCFTHRTGLAKVDGYEPNGCFFYFIKCEVIYMEDRYCKIGGVKYKVQLVKDLAREQEVLGLILYNDLTIKVDASLPQDRLEEVLIHEVLVP